LTALNLSRPETETLGKYVRFEAENQFYEFHLNLDVEPFMESYCDLPKYLANIDRLRQRFPEFAKVVFGDERAAPSRVPEFCRVHDLVCRKTSLFWKILPENLQVRQCVKDLLQRLAEANLSAETLTTASDGNLPKSVFADDNWKRLDSLYPLPWHEFKHSSHERVDETKLAEFTKLLPALSGAAPRAKLLLSILTGADFRGKR
jgi:hypothetical protein